MRLDNKTAILASSLKTHNIRPDAEEGENLGDAGDPVPARELGFKGVLLTKAQFESLVGKGAYNSFFNNGKKPPEPAFESFKRIKLDNGYKDCSAKIIFGVKQDEIEIEGGAKIKSLSVTLEETGVASLSGKLIGVFPRNVKTLDLENFLGKEIKVSLGFGDIDDDPKSTQQQLPMEPAGQEPVAESGEDETDGDE